ncbi:MAG TPA: YbaB/EbfC family nucleoid-associated protein [Pseudonocardiaceae bacterium]|nr:YbaB/EbfC family nucleoid-associated protein [Pseudonocardiaceae bacterium]
MVDPGMAPDQRINELYAQADKAVAELKARAAGVQQAQQQALQATGEATSSDGSVRVKVDATGVVTALEFSQVVFERTTPDRLAQTVVATIQTAAAQARGRMTAAMAPVRDAEPGVTAAAAKGLASLGIPKVSVPDVPRTAADPTARDAWFDTQPAQEEPPPAPEPMRAPHASNRSQRTTTDDGGEDWLPDERPW